jgi:protein N-terminal methyltransferase
MQLLPDLCVVPSAIRPLAPISFTPRTRALDVGAGIGRVTADVLLHLFSDVVLLEPAEHFIREAWARGRTTNLPQPWKGIKDKSKSVSFFQGTLQEFDPSHPSHNTKHLARIGFTPPADDTDSGFNVLWCQWCLGHLSDVDLVQFFKRCRMALRNEKSLIIVKENLYRDNENGEPNHAFDETDSSLTR